MTKILEEKQTDSPNKEAFYDATNEGNSDGDDDVVPESELEKLSILLISWEGLSLDIPPS